MDVLFRRSRNQYGVSFMIALILSSGCLLWGCHTPIQHETSVIDIKFNLKDIQPANTLNKLVKSYSIIPIETNDSALITFLNKILFRKNDMYVLDSHYKQILRYSTDGKYIGKLQRIGKGPGEYTAISDFCLDEKGNLYIVDPNQRKILIFAPDFQFIKEKKLNFYFNNISFSKDFKHIFLYTALTYNEPKYAYQLMELSTDLRVEKGLGHSIERCDNIFANSEGNGIIKKEDDQVFFFPYFSSDIYKVTNDTLLPAYHLDFGKKILTVKMANNDFDDMMNYVGKEDYISSISYVQNNDMMVYGYMDTKLFYNSFYNKTSNHVVTIVTPTDPSCGCGTVIRFVCFHNNQLVTYLSPVAVKGFVKLIDPDRNKIENEQVLEDVLKTSKQAQQENNPVLFFIHFNDF